MIIITAFYYALNIFWIAFSFTIFIDITLIVDKTTHVSGVPRYSIQNVGYSGNMNNTYKTLKPQRLMNEFVVARVECPSPLKYPVKISDMPLKKYGRAVTTKRIVP